MANGGHNGAKGAYSYEDEICLAVSKELVKMFKEEMPEIKIVESRPTEKITAIHRRAEIANENKGDLFICIHVNAAVPKKHTEISGYKTVTYYEGKGKNRKKKPNGFRFIEPGQHPIQPKALKHTSVVHIKTMTRNWQ